MKKNASKYAFTILILLLLLSMLGVGFISFATPMSTSYPLEVEVSVNKRVPVDTVVEIQVQIYQKDSLSKVGFLQVSEWDFECCLDGSTDWTDELSVGYDFASTDFTKENYYQGFSIRYLNDSKEVFSEDIVGSISCYLKFNKVDNRSFLPGLGEVYYATDGEYIAFSTKSEEEALMRLNMPTIILTVVIVAICVVAATILAIILIIKRKKRISK